jgi:hypothetical protein
MLTLQAFRMLVRWLHLTILRHPLREAHRRPGDLAGEVGNCPKIQPGKDPDAGRGEQLYGLHHEAQEGGEPRNAQEGSSQLRGGGCDTTDLLVGVWTERRSVTA